MQDDKLRHSLEDLFSDMPQTAPEGEPESPPEADAPPAAPAPRAVAPRFRPTSMTIRGRLSWGFVIVMLFLLASGLTNLWVLTRLGEANVAFQQEASRAAAARDVAQAAGNLLVALGAASSTQDVDYLTQVVDESRVSLTDAQHALSEAIAVLPPEHPVRTEASRLQARAGRTLSLAGLIVPAAQRGDWDGVQQYQAGLLTSYHLGMVESLESLVSLTEQELNAAAAEADIARRLALILPNVLALLALVAAAGTAAATIRSISRPVDRLVDGAMRLAAGNLQERVSVERGDELGGLALAFNEMADQVQRSYAVLEERVQERTRELQDANYAIQRRALQLEAASEVGRAITSIFDVDTLLRQTVELIRDHFSFYHAGIFLVDEAQEWAMLREATGQAGAQMKAQGHRLAVAESSMVGWTALHRQPRITQDVGEDAVRLAHPLLPHTRSEMTLPISIGERLIGVLNVQSTEEAAFDRDDVRALQAMADQIAIAIENARRISDEALLLEATSPIYRASRRLTTATTLEDVAATIIESVAETDADGCVIVAFEFGPEGAPEALSYLGVWRRDREPEFRPGLRLPMSESPFPLKMVSTTWSVIDVEKDEQLPESARQVFIETGARALTNIPLRTGDQVFGQVVVLRSEPGQFTDAALRLYQTLSDQATVAMERVRLLDVTRRRAEEESRLRTIGDRLAQAMDTEAVLLSAAEELGQALRATGICIELGPAAAKADDRSAAKRPRRR
jgi:GAF domain-containing protein/HAMP domain-containing protein